MTDKKVALITGGGTGTGKAIALGLAKLGVNIVVNYSRSAQEAEETAAEIRALGVSCLVEKANVANDAEVRTMVDNTVKAFGRIDYVVNSAGTTVYVDLPDLEGMKDEYFDQIFDVNVKGIFHVCRAAAKYLKESHGSIMNITSVAGFSGQGSLIAYAASKAAAISLTKSLARVLAPEVRVNSVAPGIIMSRWVAGREDHINRYGKPKALLNKVCSPDDVADVVVPLLTSAALLTGQSIILDGGMLMGK